MFLSELTFEKFADFASFWHESLKQSDKVVRVDYQNFKFWPNGMTNKGLFKCLL